MDIATAVALAAQAAKLARSLIEAAEKLNGGPLSPEDIEKITSERHEAEQAWADAAPD